MPERPGEDVALGMVAGLLGGDPTLPHEGLDQAVVLGDLDELAVGVAVHP